jgi:hypothetical protein
MINVLFCGRFSGQCFVELIQGVILRLRSNAAPSPATFLHALLRGLADSIGNQVGEANHHILGLTKVFHHAIHKP